MGAGLRLKEILRERKMTIKQLSEQADVSLNTLYSITKRDSDKIDPIILGKIAAALDVPEYSICPTSAQNEDPVLLREQVASLFPNINSQAIDDLIRMFSKMSESKTEIEGLIECIRTIAEAYEKNPNVEELELESKDGKYSIVFRVEKHK